MASDPVIMYRHKTHTSTSCRIVDSKPKNIETDIIMNAVAIPKSVVQFQTQKPGTPHIPTNASGLPKCPSVLC